MALMMARCEAGPVNGGQRLSKGELENISRKPRDLTKNRHSDSLKKGELTLSQGMIKKGDDVKVDDSHNAVRTSVLQNRVTATLCTKELFLQTQYILLPSHIRQVKCGGEGGNGQSTLHSNWSQPVSRLPANPSCNKTGLAMHTNFHKIIL
jgi:hypothetical protein